MEQVEKKITTHTFYLDILKTSKKKKGKTKIFFIQNPLAMKHN